MTDQLARYLLPTADMKRAIDRNSKQDEDLSVLLKQLEKEKKMALNHLTIKQDAFKKQVIKRQESLPQQFRVQFFQQRAVIGRDRPHPQESLQANRPLLRRTSSCGDAPGSAKFELPAVTNKRHSLPASPLPRDIREDLTSRFTFKAGSDITSLGRTQNTKNEQSKQDVSSNEDDRFEELSTNTVHSNQFYAKFSGDTAGKAIRRHSDVPTFGNLNNSRLLQRRRTTTVHMVPDFTRVNETDMRPSFKNR